MSRMITFNSKSILLLFILIASVFAGLNLNLAEAQTVRIIDIHNPTQVRVGESFRCDIEIYYEATGYILLDAQFQILDDDTGELVGETSYNVEIPEGEERQTTTLVKNSLTAPGDPRTWNLRAVLIEGNEMPFSIEIVGDESPPFVRIESLAADPESLQLGDLVLVNGEVTYSIPDGSYFEIRYTTSHGAPTSLSAYMEGVGGETPGPWIIAPEGLSLPPWMGEEDEPLRAGEVGPGGSTQYNSGVDPFTIGGDAPFEPGDWIWTFKIMYFGPDGEESQLGSREITVEVETRTEKWIVIDRVYGDYAIPGESYQVTFFGRYFFPEGGGHQIRIVIFDIDTDRYAPGDSRHDIPVHDRNSGTLTELFYPEAPERFHEINLTAIIYERTGPPDPFIFHVDKPFSVYHSGVPEERYNMEIDHVGHSPEVEYGNPLDLGVRLNYVLHPDLDTEIEINIYQLGDIHTLATQFVNVRGVNPAHGVPLSIPPELIRPRNDEWNLIAEAFSSTEYDGMLFSEHPFVVNVIGAEEGISGGSSDWMIIEGWPSNPMAIEGEEMLFWAVIGVETTDDLPQQAWLTLEIDGVEIVREAVTYLDGLVQLDFQSLSPWNATPGSHTAVWTVDPDGDYVDPDRDNNQLKFTFEVAEAMPLPSDGVVPGEEPPEPEEEFNFYVTANPTEGTLASSESYAVSVELVSGESQLVQLALVGAPAGLSYSFNPSGGMPPYMSELTVTGSSNLPAGTYSMIINATDGVRVRYKPIILNVEEGADYELSISPSSIKGQPGDIVEFTISVTSESGYNQLVNLIVSGVPGGVTSRLEPSAEEPDFQSFLILEVGLVPGEVAAVGIHDFFVTGSGIEPRQVHSTLIIEEGDEDGTIQEDGGRNLSYYLPLVYLVAILAAVVGGATYGIKRLRKPKVFCIECGKKIPADAKKCPKCDAKQEE